MWIINLLGFKLMNSWTRIFSRDHYTMTPKLTRKIVTAAITCKYQQFWFYRRDDQRISHITTLTIKISTRLHNWNCLLEKKVIGRILIPKNFVCSLTWPRVHFWPPILPGITFPRTSHLSPSSHRRGTQAWSGRWLYQPSQCDQMDELYFNIWPFATMKIILVM